MHNTPTDVSFDPAHRAAEHTAHYPPMFGGIRARHQMCFGVVAGAAKVVRQGKQHEYEARA